MQSLNSNLTRRTLLAGAGAAAGSLLVGWRPALGSAPEAGQMGTPAATEVTLATWLRVNPDNTVTVYVAQAEMGQGVMTSLAALVAEELGMPWEQVRAEMPDSDPRFRTKRGRRVTGNSDSVMSSFGPLRKAGAAAREMLTSAAAQRWQVPVSECVAADGQVRHAATGHSASYGNLSAAAAALPVPASPALKPASAWQLIGKPLPRKDVPEKVAGSAVFGVDVELDGLQTATIMACPSFGGRLARVDAAPALAQPGVTKVVSLENAVAVVGKTYWHALQGLNALRPTWDVAAVARENGPEIAARLREALTSDGAVGKATGDPTPAFAAANKVVEATYEAPLLAHMCLEPMNATVRISGDRVEVWAPTQAETDTAVAVAKTLGVPPDNVIVHTTLMGGGFGRRTGTDFAVQAASVARVVGTPVKLIWSREEDLRHDFYRPPMASRYRGALDGEGKLTAMEVHVAGPSLIEAFGMPPNLDPMIHTMASSGDAYKIANLKLTYARRNINVPLGIWRSTMLSQHGFFAESFVDELAHAAGRNPLAFRQELVTGNPQGAATLAALADSFDFGRRSGKKRGWGLAIAAGWNSTCAAAMEISLEGKTGIRIHDIACAIHCGTVINPAIVESQVQGAFLYGLDAALWGDITMQDGQVVEGNFNSQPALRMDQAPAVRVTIVQSDGPPGGVGEIATAVAAPALTNAIFAVHGTRVRALPVKRAGYTLQT